MTLYRQLLTWMLAIFFLLVVTIFGIELNTTRNFLLSQQSNEVTNTVNALGLALSPYLEDHDEVAIESVINALFDGGFYKQVKLKMFTDSSEIIRQYPIKVSGVPNWFVDLDLFPTIVESRVFTSGWRQLAKVEITANPGFAYQEMWKTSVQLLMWIAVLFLIAIGAIGFQLTRSLKPLKEITFRVGEIANNKFDEELPIPPTIELKKVVDSINNMSKKLKLYFEEQSKEADKLREKAFIDPVAGIGNRRFFMAQLSSWIAESAVGGIIMTKVSLITDCYQEQGFEKADALVNDFSKKVKELIRNSDYTFARLSKDEFSLLLPSASKDELEFHGQNLINIIHKLQKAEKYTAPKIAVGIAVNNNQNKEISLLLAQADNALSQAESNPTQPLVIINEMAADNVLGKQQWKELLLDAIANQWFVFKFQTVINTDKAILHKEMFTAIEHKDVYFTAGHFLAKAEQLGLAPAFDRYVITQAFSILESNPSHETIAINLTPSSVVNASFILWLSEMMKKHLSLSEKLLFEISENVFIRYPEHLALLIEQFQRYEFSFGVDNYGRHFQSLDYLTKFKPNYVKIDFAYTSNFNDEDRSTLLASISRTAHNLGITTIATRVETRQQLIQLSKLYVDGFQGFIFDK